MIKGVILDFNGTLYRDHDLNDRAWMETFYKVAGEDSKYRYEDFDVSTETLNKDHDHSKAILNRFNKDDSEEEILKLSKYKEDLYMKYAKEANRKQLMEGAEEFLYYLIKNNIPYCIASMAPLWNFNFYLDYLHLDKWFTFDNIVYDTVEYPNKNLMYQEAARRMNINIEDALLFEDSPKVIKKAPLSGVNKIIYLNSKNKELSMPEIIQEIKDFRDFDYSILEK